MTERRTTVVVVTWNSAQDIESCLDAIPAAMEGAGAWDVVVVDNGSSDATVEFVRRRPGDVSLIEVGRNAGYAAGINAGIAARPYSDGYLLLNPDVRLRPGCVAQLWRASDIPGVGIAVPRLLDARGGLQWSMRREPAVMRALGEAVLGGRRAGRFDALGEVVTVADSYDHARDVDWATGAVWLVTAACAAEVGSWDESYFLYSEETDYALRARDAGLRTRFTPQAEAVHVGGDVHVSPALYMVLTRNRVVLYSRRHGRAPSLAFWCCVLLNEVLRSRSPVHRAAARALVAGAPWLSGGRREAR